jgi:hypothetical protein
MRFFSLSAVAAIALSFSAASAGAAPFDVYRAACLDTGNDLARIRAASKSWSPLSDVERETLAPGNPRAVEGWVVVQAGGRYLVSISSSTASGMAGDRSGSKVISCSVLTPKSDEKAALKSYSDYLKRAPASSDTSDGISTYTWSIQDSAGLSLHYLVAGGTLPGLSLSVSSIQN